jgi:hypothetical protein
VGHEGSISTFGSRLVMVPEAGAAVVLLFNRAPGFWTQAEAITDAILDQLHDLPRDAPLPKGIEPDCPLWPRYKGTFLGDWRGLAIVEVQNSQLTFVWNGERLVLDALRGDLYSGRKSGGGEPVSVGFVSEGEELVQFIQVNSSPCRRVQLDIPWVPDPGSWTAYAGRYRGVETLIVRVVEDRLLVYSEDVEWGSTWIFPRSLTTFTSETGAAQRRSRRCASSTCG